jgi:hypothetical protein
MTNWSTLKAAIASIIKTNGNKEITGQLLQNVLNNIVSSVGENSTFAGIATPATNPGVPDGPVFYLTATAGIYSNFNGIEVQSGEAVILIWDNNTWSKKVTGFATQEKLSELDSRSYKLLDIDTINVTGNGVAYDIITIKTKTSIKRLSAVVVEVGDIISSAPISQSLLQCNIAFKDGTFQSINAAANSRTENKVNNEKEISEIRLRVYTSQSVASEKVSYVYNNCKIVGTPFAFENTGIPIQALEDNFPNLWGDPHFNIIGTVLGDSISGKHNIENSPYGKAVRLYAEIGERPQIAHSNTGRIEVIPNTPYSLGFLYKQIAGTKRPKFTQTNFQHEGFSFGTYSEVNLGNGWIFSKVTNVQSPSNITHNLQAIIDFDNRTGSEYSEVLITNPVVVVGGDIKNIPVWSNQEVLKKISENSIIALFDKEVSRIGTGLDYSYDILLASGSGTLKTPYAGNYISVKVSEGITTNNNNTFLQLCGLDSKSNYVFRLNAFKGDEVIEEISTDVYRIEIRLYTGILASENTAGYEYKIDNVSIKVGQQLSVQKQVNELKKNGVSSPLPWNDKNLLTYGDSITAINNGTFNGPFVLADDMSWGNRVAALCGFLSHRGRGVGGQTYVWNTNTWFADENGNYVGRPSMGGSKPTGSSEVKGSFCSWERIVASVPNVSSKINCIILMGGTNDFTNVKEYVTPIWSAENTLDTDWVNSSLYNGGDFDVSDFCGAIASTIMKWQIRCPRANIVLATPLPWWERTSPTPSVNPHGLTMFDVARIEEKVAHFMGIPVIDLNGECNINGVNYTDYITDAVHPYSNTGKKAIGNYIAGKLNTINPKE